MADMDFYECLESALEEAIRHARYAVEDLDEKGIKTYGNAGIAIDMLREVAGMLKDDLEEVRGICDKMQQEEDDWQLANWRRDAL